MAFDILYMYIHACTHTREGYIKQKSASKREQQRVRPLTVLPQHPRSARYLRLSSPRLISYSTALPASPVLTASPPSHGLLTVL